MDLQIIKYSIKPLCFSIVFIVLCYTEDKNFQYLFKALFHTFSLYVNLLIFYLEGWVYLENPWNIEVISPQRVQFVQIMWDYQIAFSLYSLFSCCFLEKRRFDFKMMVAHHVATIMLISFACFNGYHKIGLTILSLHDPPDPFIQLAKYFKEKQKNCVK